MTPSRSGPPPPRRRWTILLVPPDPTRTPRALHVSMRRLRVAGVTAATATALMTVWLAADVSQVGVTADELASAQRLIVALGDSLRQLDDSLRTTVLRVAAPAALQGSSNGGIGARHVVVAPARAALARPAEGIVLPVIGEITSRFARSRFHPLLRIFRPHHGVDVSAPAGTNISAPAGGRVTFVGRRFGDGLTVELDHGDGVVSRYAHCRKALVHEGDEVGAGAVIATVGSSGLATGPHLHFEILVRGRPVDPLKYLLTNRPPTHEAAIPSTERQTAPAGSPQQ